MKGFVRNAAGILSLLLGVSTIDGCQQCDSATCETNVTIKFFPTLSSEGDYRMSGAADGRIFDCQLTLPLVGDANCSSPEWRMDVRTPSGSPNGPKTIFGMYLAGSPGNLTINVERNGTTIGKSDLAPSYEQIAPNGESCGPVCKVTQTNMALNP